MAKDSSFPEGWFYIKSQANNHVLEPHCLSVNSGARIVASKQRFGFDADSQVNFTSECKFMKIIIL